MRRRLALAALAGLVPLWTWGLLHPNPVPPAVKGLLGFWDQAFFVAAKLTHAGVYGLLALLGVAAAWPSRRALGLAVGAVMLHGVATEIGQTFVPNRHGCVQDVLIDWAGVGAAVLLCVQVLRWRRGRLLPVSSPLEGEG